MVEAISIFTISTIAFLVTLFHRNFFTGTGVAYLIHVVWTMFFQGGFALPLLQIMVNWFWATLLWALVGWMFATLWKAPPLFNGQFLGKIYKASGDGESMVGDIPNGIGSTVAKILFVVIWLGVSHIWFELDVSWLPKPWGGVLTLVFITIGYIIFYFLFRNNTEIFRSKSPGNEVFGLAFYTWAIHAFYTLTYFLFDAYLSTTTFIDNQWYFYISLIIGAFVFIMVWVVSRTLRAETNEPGWMKMKGEN